MSSENKLQSLQGLRGISILLVLIFHMFPKNFLNGFVGVDMFFVLSGYLMTRILTKTFTASSIINFYKKRFSRIVPLYYLTIFFTILGVLCLVLKVERIEFLIDVKWCLSILSNFQPIFEHRSYWDQLSTIRFLTHLWSLATELQYYLIVPIIHSIAINLSFYLRIFGYIIAIIILFLFQLLTPFELSYAFLVSRVWQFLMGSIAFELSRRREETKDLNSEKPNGKGFKEQCSGMFPVFFSFTLTTVIMLPGYFGEHLTRLIMSLSAAGLCYLCGELENTFFTLKPLVFIGDISYVTYLVHWPVINFVRYIQQKDDTNLSILEALITIVIVFALSLLLSFAVEKKLLKYDFHINFIVTAVLIATCLSMIPFIESQECFSMKTLPADVIEKVENNFEQSKLFIDFSELKCDFNEATTAASNISTQEIEYCSKKGNGIGKVLVIGNSLSIRAFPTIFNIFNGSYEEIRIFAKHAGAPLLKIFPDYTQAAVDMAQEMKPDLIWIIQGMNEILFSPGSTYNFESKALDRVVQTTLDEFKELTNMIFIDLPYYITKKIPTKLIARSLIYRKNLEEKLSVSLEEVEDQLKEQRERLLNLNCTNCYFNDVQKALTNGDDKFYLYDKETYSAPVYDGSHLSLAGYKSVETLYRKKIEQFYESLD